MKNIFQEQVTNEIINRINQLTSSTTPKWGKMTVGQMLAHCSVTYEMVYTDKHKPMKGIKKFLLKKIVKPYVTTEKPYKKNSHTAPAFIMKEDKSFEPEKARLIEFIKRSQHDGEKFYDGRESLSFGKLTASEWNIMFYKHLDHHLTQFGV